MVGLGDGVDDGEAEAVAVGMSVRSGERLAGRAGRVGGFGLRWMAGPLLVTVMVAAWVPEVVAISILRRGGCGGWRCR